MPLYVQGPSSGSGRGLEVEVDIVGDEEVEVAVAVVVDEGAAGVPADLGAGLGEAGLLGDVGEGSVAVVAVKGVLAVVGNEEVVVAVVVVVADTAGLAPAGLVLEAGAFGHVCEGAVAIVFEEAAVRLLAGREAFQAPAVDEEEVLPAVVVIVVKGEAAAGGFKEVLVGQLAAVDGLLR